MKILVAPSGFKESLSPEEVADCIEEGILRVLPDAQIVKIPLVDGGEGFAKTLVRLTGGKIYQSIVTGPVGEPVRAHWGLLGGVGPKTAILEMAAAAGLRLVPDGLRNPLVTTTFGVGELIKMALDEGVERILIGCADSGTTDGGAGMAQALGIRLLDESGRPVKRGGGALKSIACVDLSTRDARIDQVQIDVACNFNTVLCGPLGTARLFGPQKGATPLQVEELAQALERLALVINRDLAIDVRTLPGGGAAGGLGAGLRAFVNAKLHHRYEIIMRYMDLDGPLREADLVVTAEGCIDFTTARGKIPCEVARRAKQLGIPTVAIVGKIGQNADVTLQHGIDAYTSIIDSPMQNFAALERAPNLLRQGAESLARTLLVGKRLAERRLESFKQFEEFDREVAQQAGGSFDDMPSFMEQLSLDMRTPLNIVIAYAKMMKDGLLGAVSPAQSKALAHAIKHSYWMLSIINSLMRSISGGHESISSNETATTGVRIADRHLDGSIAVARPNS
jgi:glycerate kinase